MNSCCSTRVHLLMHQRQSVVGDILRILSPTLLALSDVRSDLNVSPCDQQDRKDLCLFQIANTHWWRRMMEMRKPHARPILPGSTVPCDVRSDLNLWLFPQQERTAFVVSSELSVWSAPCISNIHSGQSSKVIVLLECICLVSIG